MVTNAFVLIEVHRDEADEVKTGIRQIEGVRSADKVTPPYDLIAMIEGENLTSISELVTDKICHVEGITRTVICPVIDVEAIGQNVG